MTTPRPGESAGMLEIRIHGRGGQGAQVACQILADAFSRAGAWVQAFAAYGAERRGAPVIAFLRVDDRPIRLRCDIEQPDHVLVLDPTLLGDLGAADIHEGGTLVVNSPAAPCGFLPAAERVVALDASAIARRLGLGPIVSTAILGGFAGATRLVTLEDLTRAVEARSPVKKDENVAACTMAYLETAYPHGMETLDAW
ncbi:MAG: 2-oxoacid:acceptor oxidoreductase family protein [Candidatus Rokubacteria bacterium]|nr:2-oxoacid:acceptor oxidoreductase family protein [Candidatus Rokubacteria bacterium]